MESRLRLDDCWAKTDKDGEPSVSVAEHCFLAGVVAEEVIARMGKAVSKLAPRGAPGLVAAHDIGKISPGFLSKAKPWADQWKIRLKLGAGGHETRHALVSQQFVASLYARPPRWLMALGGHHGKYICTDARPGKLPFGGGAPEPAIFRELRQELMEGLVEEFGEMPQEEDIDKGARLHWFTGLMVFCDWIASSEDLIEEGESDGGARGWGGVRKKGRAAVSKLGWGSGKIRSNMGFGEIFGVGEMRPLQKALSDCCDRPGLYILEAAMGEGKTEAALMAAYRRWCDGSERGIYFALPTQLTSNKLAERVEPFLSSVLEEESPLALLHGNAWMGKGRIRGEGAVPEVFRWFADNRKSMLVPHGVGTVDQALMAVTPVKHSAIRLFGLAGKVVVIDEVHSYDPYTSHLVDRLVEWLINLGSTVIVLSATLTAKRRAGLVKAAGGEEEQPVNSYPLVTKVDSATGKTEHIHVDGRKEEKRILIEMVQEDSEIWVDEAVRAAEAGACVLIIRNTVDLARRTYLKLRASCRDTGIEFGLVHSRFTVGDRERNEGRWTKLYGKNGEERPRNGAILVGTQVLEQSLDIDGDILFTDLCPTDAVLQRKGRLHRHKRERVIGFEVPRCVVLCRNPDWEGEAGEVKNALKPHSLVYPPYELYRAEMVYKSRGEIMLPRDIRKITEGDGIPEDLPNAVKGFRRELEELETKMRNSAWMQGVFKSPEMDDKEGVQTRWGMRPTVKLVLLRERPVQSGDGVNLLFLDGTSVYADDHTFNHQVATAMHRNSVRINSYLVGMTGKDSPRWLDTHADDAVVGWVDETDEVSLWSGDTGKFRLFYQHDSGLSCEKIQGCGNMPKENDQDDWG
ncbi:MAG: CRISPR-associated helicase Cas3' [Terrimicrobiaceae bacterium]